MPQLLPLEALIQTGPVDRADWNYRPVLGPLQRLRFQMVCKLLPSRKQRRLLEVGYGSGVFMPELSRHCDHLYGIDIHPHAVAVQEELNARGISAELTVGSAELLPYDDETFDCVVAVSSLEFIHNINAAAGELKRVLRPDGCLVLATPGHSPILDLALKICTGECANNDYSDRRERLMPTLLEYFRVDAQKKFPTLLHRVVCLYSALRLRPQAR